MNQIIEEIKQFFTTASKEKLDERVEKINIVDYRDKFIERQNAILERSYYPDKKVIDAIVSFYDFGVEDATEVACNNLVNILSIANEIYQEKCGKDMFDIDVEVANFRLQMRDEH